MMQAPGSNRVGRACARCRRNKSRCDSFRPCALCTRAGASCVEDGNTTSVTNSVERNATTSFPPTPTQAPHGQSHRKRRRRSPSGSWNHGVQEQMGVSQSQMANGPEPLQTPLNPNRGQRHDDEDDHGDSSIGIAKDVLRSSSGSAIVPTSLTACRYTDLKAVR